MTFPALLTVSRDDVVEVVVHGAVALATPDRVLGGVAADALVYARSTVKPYAAKATFAGLADLDDAALAVCCASHDGTEAHLGLARRVAGGAADHLATPPSLPLAQARLQVAAPDPWRHPCSGEHAGVLHACGRLGWPGAYLAADHPRTAAIRAWQRRWLGPGWAPRHVATDGCGLPTDALPVGELARLYAGIAASRDEDRVWAAMVAHPEVVGGPGRLDTRLLQAGAGRLVAKEGADGLLALALAGPVPLGVVVKVAHGWDPVAAWRVGAAVLGPVAAAWGIELPPAPPVGAGQGVGGTEALGSHAAQAVDGWITPSRPQGV